MTKLSPAAKAAKAALNAYEDANDKYEENVLENEYNIIAAVVRSLASSMRDMYENVDGMSVIHDPEDFLDAVANEFCQQDENTTGDESDD